MPSAGPVLLCGIAALLFWGSLGLALSRRLAPISLSLPIAPGMGWAVHGALALPLYRLVGFTAWTVGVTSLLALMAAWLLLPSPAFAEGPDSEVRVPLWAYALAAVLAAVPAIALFPKIHGDAMTLAAPIFDHSKIAIVDEMTRLGVPPSNPFFGEANQETPLAYYYLWHFSAAELASVFGVSGWEADIAITGFTAFASLALMMGFATWVGGRSSAGVLVLPFAFAASLRPPLEGVFGENTVQAIFLRATGLGGWLFQTTWAPQHVASAACVLLSSFLLVQLARRPSPLIVVVLALVSVAGFESSTWVGGIVLVLAAPASAAILLMDSPPDARIRFVTASLGAALLAGALAFPFLRDQLIYAAARGASIPIALQPYPVFQSSNVLDGWGRIFDIPGYWLALLAIEFPAIYVPGLIALVGSLRSNLLSGARRQTSKVFGALMLVSLLVTGYLSLTFTDNNDLGWRAVLPATFVLITFTSIGVSRWVAARSAFAVGAALLLLLLGLPQSYLLLAEAMHGTPSSSDRAFAATPAMWQAVRRHASPSERIANNPLFMQKMTPWPVNISWALSSDRRSCFAGREFALAFTSLPRRRLAEIEDQFRRVFDGDGNPGDVRDLATRYQCRVIVLTSQDGAWSRDPFAKSPAYTLVEEKAGAWKIYRAVDATPEPMAPNPNP
jgi:hypothetical protein